MTHGGIFTSHGAVTVPIPGLLRLMQHSPLTLHIPQPHFCPRWHCVCVRAQEDWEVCSRMGSFSTPVRPGPGAPASPRRAGAAHALSRQDGQPDGSCVSQAAAAADHSAFVDASPDRACCGEGT